GFEYLYAPIAEISSSRCVYYRAFLTLVLSLGFYIYGLTTLLSAMLIADDSARQHALEAASSTLWPSLVLGTTCYIWYALSKRILISVVARGSVRIGISCKRGLLGSSGVELKKTIAAVDLMNSRILAKRT